jgi:hypothetical protein
MYEHPIKRAGLSFNRILFSNTRAVQNSFTSSNPLRFQLTYMVKKYDNGKEIAKNTYSSDDLDAVMPATHTKNSE